MYLFDFAAKVLFSYYMWGNAFWTARYVVASCIY